MKICLAANSGGHLNQLLQLKYFYCKHEHFFLTNRTMFSEGLAANEKVYFVDKFVVREVLKKFQYHLPLKNVFQTLIPIVRERPDLIVTTGAGVALGACILGKLMFKKLIFIESIARTSEPSTFGKIIRFFADEIIVQWKNIQPKYRGSTYAGLIFNFSGIKTASSGSIRNILVMTGTYKLQFNRLLKELDSLLESGALKCKITAQIADSDYKPINYEYFDYSSQADIHRLIDRSDLVICQGGSGSIMDSLLRGKRVIAVPRLMQYKEFFDDHQIQLVDELEKMGLIMAVYDITMLGETIARAGKFTPNFSGVSTAAYTSVLERFMR